MFLSGLDWAHVLICWRMYRDRNYENQRVKWTQGHCYHTNNENIVPLLGQNSIIWYISPLIFLQFLSHPAIHSEMNRKWKGREFMKLRNGGWKSWQLLLFNIWCLFDLVFSPILLAVFSLKKEWKGKGIQCTGIRYSVIWWKYHRKYLKKCQWYLGHFWNITRSISVSPNITNYSNGSFVYNTRHRQILSLPECLIHRRIDSSKRWNWQLAFSFMVVDPGGTPMWKGWGWSS